MSCYCGRETCEACNPYSPQSTIGKAVLKGAVDRMLEQKPLIDMLDKETDSMIALLNENGCSIDLGDDKALIWNQLSAFASKLASRVLDHKANRS